MPVGSKTPVIKQHPMQRPQLRPPLRPSCAGRRVMVVRRHTRPAGFRILLQTED